jgi:RNA polymerase sigma factor (sigma-70 family)
LKKAKFNVLIFSLFNRLFVIKRGEREYSIDFNDVLKGCCRGDLKAQEDLCKQYYGYVMSIAVRFSSCHDNALEIANDSFLKIFRKIESYQIDKEFKTWVRKIVVNTAIDYFRKDKKNYNEISIEAAYNEPADKDVSNKLSAEEIIKLINSMPVKYRYSFNLFEIEGYSHDEIAMQLGITASSSRANLTRAKKMLRKMILINSRHERVV